MSLQTGEILDTIGELPNVAPKTSKKRLYIIIGVIVAVLAGLGIMIGVKWNDWFGTTTSKGECNNHGTSSGGQCICGPGYIGLNCELYLPTSRVYVFDESIKDADIQEQIDAVSKDVTGYFPGENNGQFSKNRVALLFKPGQYHVNINIGYYMTVMGLGPTPNDTIINGDVHVRASSQRRVVGSLNDFWRGASNLTIKPDSSHLIWACSQATYFRRIIVVGDVHLFEDDTGQYNPYDSTTEGAPFASGGYMSNCQITGHIECASQQQYCFRNVTTGAPTSGGVWNIVFIGCNNPDVDKCSGGGLEARSVVQRTPRIREPPFLGIQNNQWVIFRPELRHDSIGHDFTVPPAVLIDDKTVYVTNPSDSAEKINKQLSQGKHLIISPGIYSLDKALLIQKPNTVVISLGFATLVAAQGNACVKVQDGLDGVQLVGIFTQAGSQTSKTLLEWGTKKGQGETSKNPGCLYDSFARVGGPDTSPVHTENMAIINSNFVIGDNAWFWLADHTYNGENTGSGIGWGKNKCDHAIQINGDSVTYYGLMCEHTDQDLTVWRGDYGECYMYQSEFRYDPPSQQAYDNVSSYVVESNVSNHKAVGIGAYSFFPNTEIWINSGIRAPALPGVTFETALSVHLKGLGGIRHVIKNKGKEVSDQGPGVEYVCNFP